MDFPLIIAFEGSSHETSGFPVAVAWTLADAMYKAVFIKPEDEWLARIDVDETPMDRSVQDLIDLGESSLDVVKEMSRDLETDVLYCEDVDYAQGLIERLFDSNKMEMPWEIVSVKKLFDEFPEAEVDNVMHFMMDKLDLAPHEAEANVLLWRAVYAHLKISEVEQ